MSYARLGITCDTSNRILIDNTKFFPVNSNIYKKYWVKMMEYPAHDQPFIHNIGELDRPEDLKTGGDSDIIPETHLSKPGCCGKK